MFSSFKNKNFSWPFISWIIVILWYLGFSFIFSPSLSVRLKTQDIIYQQSSYLFPQSPGEKEDIVIVTIDEVSRLHLGIKYPWPRKTYAQLIRNLSSFSPKVIGLDVVFSGKSETDQDQELIAALRTHPNIVLACSLREEEEKSTFPLPEFTAAAGSMGYITKSFDNDGVARKIRVFQKDKKDYTHFAIEIQILARYLNTTPGEIRTNLLILGEKLFSSFPDNMVTINYLCRPGAFLTIPAYLVLENKINPQFFKNKIVLVGATDPLLHDEHPTPLGIFSGVTIIANTLVMFLSKRILYALTLWQIFIPVFLLAVLILFINVNMRIIPSSFITAGTLLLIFFGAIYLRARDIQFDYFSVFFILISSYAVTNIYKYGYLLYMSNKLRNLAIVEPLTGFFTPRYFSLKLDEQLKDKSRPLVFFTLVISNYKKLSLDLNFEQLQSLIRLLTGYIESNIGARYKKKIISRMAQDSISVAVWEKHMNIAQKFFCDFTGQLGNVEFKLKDNVIKISPKGILIYKPQNKKTTGAKIIYFMESLLKDNSVPQKYFVAVELKERMVEEKKKTSSDDVLDFLATDLEDRNKDLEKSLKELLESKKETETAYFEVICALITALEEKDSFTKGHSQRVANYALALAKEVNLSDDDCDRIYNAGLLHDIGKIGIPDYTLHKKEKFTDEEYELIKKHEIMSVEILKPIKPFADLLLMILHHHEKFDGTGYPHGLSGDMIPRGAQILAVADVFDAITCGRGYKKGVNVDDAIKEMERCSGTQFNPIYVEAFKKAISSGKIKF